MVVICFNKVKKYIENTRYASPLKGPFFLLWGVSTFLYSASCICSMTHSTIGRHSSALLLEAFVDCGIFPPASSV